MQTFKALLSAALLMVAGTAFAGSNDGQLAVTDSAAFDAQAKVIRTALDDGKTYSELTAKQREDVSSALGRIRDDLSTYSGVATMPEEIKVRMFNDQELVNTILTAGREDSRLLCTRVTPVGSHRPMNQCKTVAERRRERDRSLEILRNQQQPVGLKSN